MTKVNVIVSVDEAHLSDILEVVEALSKAGCSVEQILDSVGVIAGVCDAQILESLRHIPGVAAVETEQTYQLPPPDSEIQ